MEEDLLVVPQQDAKRSEWGIGGEEKACVAGGGAVGVKVKKIDENIDYECAALPPTGTNACNKCPSLHAL